MTVLISKTNLLIVVVVILILLLSVTIWFRSEAPFDYRLTLNLNNGTVMQGGSIVINVNVTYLQGIPETVTLNAISDSNLFCFTFSVSNQTGKPTHSNSLTRSLTIDVASTVPSDIYVVHVSARASNGKEHSQSYELTVLNSEIQVSGTVTLNSRRDIWPSEIHFISTSTNTTFSTIVDLSIPNHYGGIVDLGTYNVTLPNQQNYKVICLWDGLFGTGPLPFPVTLGTFDFGTLFVDGGVGVTSMSKDYSG
jgi:hypothetical protein